MDIPPDDGLKWFGEGFDGFPKHLPNDTVEYVIYVVNAKLNETQIRSRLAQVLKDSRSLSREILKEYIWQREAFSLELKRDNDQWLLFGRTSFGDSIADEWLIVYMLRELSKQFPEVWIRVHDSDGEFLLIEAAGALHGWLKPEIAERRVWINKGQLLIIPLIEDNNTSEIASNHQALKMIALDASSLVHSPLIEEEAFYRLKMYPEGIQHSLHSALVTIPRKLAYILRSKRSLTSAAVEAFYLRDPISLRPLNKSSTSELIFPPEDFVTVSVRFNRASFAQLKSQDFPLPKAWDTAAFLASSDPRDAARRVLGVKLTCGVEMLVQDPQNKDKTSVREIYIMLKDLGTGDETLPSDIEINTWPRDEDSEEWMDIKYEDLERELHGLSGPDNTSTETGLHEGAFGDKAAQENLRRLVKNMEKWMNDEDAGFEGAELGGIASDDSDDDDDEEATDSDEEDRAVSFDENEFHQMMRQMMGMPSNNDAPVAQKKAVDREQFEHNQSEDEEIRLLSEAMEAELFAAGALAPDSGSTKGRVRQDRKKQKDKEITDDATKMVTRDEGHHEEGSELDEDDQDAEVQIDYNLAYNMLEAFKGQAGLAGPASNMMGMMGIAMPREEKVEDENE